MLETKTLTTPIDSQIVRKKILDSNLPCIGKASIREILHLINQIEIASGKKFIRMEMGVPGIPANKVAVEAEIGALQKGVANKYPPIEGVREFKEEVSRFAKLFLDIDVSPQCCIPVTGSTGGSFISFLFTSKLNQNKDTVLFINPGFPVHMQQAKALGIKEESFDVYNYRGKKLRDKLESYLSKGNIFSLLYSSPNNPAWICFNENELKIIGELCTKYDVIALEDLAYFNMDFRKDYSKPGQPPYQPSVSKFTDNYMLLISSSKIFSYAGQRIGSLVVSEKLFKRKYPDLKRFFTSDEFGHALVYGAAYAVSAGVTHSTQYAIASMLKQVNDGDYNFTNDVKVYAERGEKIKKIFLDNGFKLVYDSDDGEPIADGFYFTISYPEFTGEQLIEELIYYGISAISLSNTGSERKEGVRACVSLISEEQFPELEQRLKAFKQNHET